MEYSAENLQKFFETLMSFIQKLLDTVKSFVSGIHSNSNVSDALDELLDDETTEA